MKELVKELVTHAPAGVSLWVPLDETAGGVVGADAGAFVGSAAAIAGADIAGFVGTAAAAFGGSVGRVVALGLAVGRVCWAVGASVTDGGVEVGLGVAELQPTATRATRTRRRRLITVASHLRPLPL